MRSRSILSTFPLLVVLLILATYGPLHEQTFAPATTPSLNSITPGSDLEVAKNVAEKALIGYGFLIESSSNKIIPNFTSLCLIRFKHWPRKEVPRP